MDLLHTNFHDPPPPEKEKRQCLLIDIETGELVPFAAQVEERGLNLVEKVDQAKTPAASLSVLNELGEAARKGLFDYIFDELEEDDRDNEDYLDEILDLLQAVTQRIIRIIEGQEFEDKQHRASFSTRVKAWLKAMLVLLERWDEYIELCDELEVSCAKKNFIYPSDETEFFNVKLMPTFAVNRATRHTLEGLTQAEKKGMDIRLRHQRLPRGCMTIIEQWRSDVGAIVESILQANESNETRQQEASMLESYFLLERDSTTGKERKRVQPMFMRDFKYVSLKPRFHREPRSSTASLLCKLVGTTRGSLANQNYCWQFDSYSCVPGVRTIEQSVDDELEDML